MGFQTQQCYSSYQKVSENQDQTIHPFIGLPDLLFLKKKMTDPFNTCLFATKSLQIQYTMLNQT